MCKYEREGGGLYRVLQAMKRLQTLCCTMRNLVETHTVNKAPTRAKLKAHTKPRGNGG